MLRNGKPAMTMAKHPIYGARGKYGDYPGCTPQFVKGVRKRRAKNKVAAASRRKNRSKK